MRRGLGPNENARWGKAWEINLEGFKPDFEQMSREKPGGFPVVCRHRSWPSPWGLSRGLQARSSLTRDCGNPRVNLSDDKDMAIENPGWYAQGGCPVVG
jgi:hypothetical protein